MRAICDCAPGYCFFGGTSRCRDGDDEDFEMKISLDVERGETLFFVTSPNVRGLLVAGSSLADVLAKVPDALEEMDSVQPVAPYREMIGRPAA